MLEGIDRTLNQIRNVLDRAKDINLTRRTFNKGSVAAGIGVLVGHERHQEEDSIKQLLDRSVKPWTETIDIIPPPDGDFKDPTFIQQLEANEAYLLMHNKFQIQKEKIVDPDSNELSDFTIVDHIASSSDGKVYVSMAIQYNRESQLAQQTVINPPAKSLILLDSQNPDQAILLRPHPDNGTIPVLATAQFQGENYPVVLWVPPTGESAPIYILVNKDGQWVPELLVDNSNLYAEKKLSLVFAKFAPEVLTPEEFYETYEFQDGDQISLDSTGVQVQTGKSGSVQDKWKVRVIRDGVTYSGLPVIEQMLSGGEVEPLGIERREHENGFTTYVMNGAFVSKKRVTRIVDGSPVQFRDLLFAMSSQNERSTITLRIASPEDFVVGYLQGSTVSNVPVPEVFEVFNDLPPFAQVKLYVGTYYTSEQRDQILKEYNTTLTQCQRDSMCRSFLIQTTNPNGIFTPPEAIYNWYLNGDQTSFVREEDDTILITNMLELIVNPYRIRPNI